MGKSEPEIEVALPFSGKRKSRKAAAKAAREYAESFFQDRLVIVVSLVLRLKSRRAEIGLMLYPDAWKADRYDGRYCLLPSGGDLDKDEAEKCLAAFRKRASRLITEFLLNVRKTK